LKRRLHLLETLRPLFGAWERCPHTATGQQEHKTMTKRTYFGAAVFAAAIAAGGAADAQATTLVALTGDKTLVSINAEQRRVVNRVQVNGINGRLRCIDVRPLDKMLYGVVADGTVVTINPGNGSTGFKSTLQQNFPAGVQVTCDFNPAADRLRMIGSDGTNQAANVDDGTVTVNTPINFAVPNPFGGVTPSVIAGAYSNNVAGVKATQLWDIDNATDALYLQVPPALGTLFAVGNQLGISPGTIGFDIQTKSGGVHIAWLINGNLLYQVGLVSGLAKGGQPIAGYTGPARDLAVVLP
jgi:hypothetical protein